MKILLNFSYHKKPRVSNLMHFQEKDIYFFTKKKHTEEKKFKLKYIIIILLIKYCTKFFKPHGSFFWSKYGREQRTGSEYNIKKILKKYI